MLSRVFKSGNSIAVRIPKEIAILSAAQEVEIERGENRLVIDHQQYRRLQGLAKSTQRELGYRRPTSADF